MNKLRVIQIGDRYYLKRRYGIFGAPSGPFGAWIEDSPDTVDEHGIWYKTWIDASKAAHTINGWR